MDISDDAFTVGEWNEAISYIFGEQKAFGSVQQAKEYFVGRLAEK